MDFIHYSCLSSSELVHYIQNLLGGISFIYLIKCFWDIFVSSHERQFEYVHGLFVWLQKSSVNFEICSYIFWCILLPSGYVRVTLDVFWILRDMFAWLWMSSANFGICSYGFRCIRLPSGFVLMSSTTFGICLRNFRYLRLNCFSPLVFAVVILVYIILYFYSLCDSFIIFLIYTSSMSQYELYECCWPVITYTY